MKPYLLISIAVAGVSAAAHAQVKTENLSSFNSIDISSPVFAEVYKSDSSYVVFPDPGDSPVKMVYRVEDNTLDISDGFSSPENPVKIYTSSLQEIDISSAGGIKLMSPFDGNNMEIDLSGASTLSGDMSYKTIDIDVSGAGNLQLTGKADSVSVEASGAANLNLEGLAARVMDLEISGAAAASVNVEKEIWVEGSGVYSLKIKGVPIVHRDEENIPGAEAPGDKHNWRQGPHNRHFPDISTWNNLIWVGVDLGFNGFMDKGVRFQPTDPYEFMELDYSRSANVRLNLLEVHINLNKSKTVNLVPGFGVEWNHYSFKEKIFLQEREELDNPGAINTSLVNTADSTTAYIRTRLVTKQINLPLFLNFCTKKGGPDKKQFNFSIGVVANFLVGKNFRVTYNDNDQKIREKYYRDYGLGVVNATAMVRIRYWFLNFYASYTFTDLFRGPDSPFLKGWSAGFSFSI